jgi:pimeloyl-ACP methyl ester carboxylesterase
VERNGAIDVAGRPLAWRSLGDGPPLVLLNGYAATTLDWDPRFLAALAEQFEVVCPDYRGMGDSPLGDVAGLPTDARAADVEGLGDVAGLTIDALAADVEALLDALAIGRAPVVGWSMGGFVAQALALRAPARVGALVLLATDPGGAAATLADPDVWARLISRDGSPREQATRLLSLIFPAPVAAEIDREVGDVVAAARARLAPEALSAQEAAIVAWHAAEPPRPASPLPMLALHGNEDIVIPPANADALAARWPACRVERVAGGGHAFMAQEPERVAELVTTFVREAGRRGDRTAA